MAAAQDKKINELEPLEKKKVMDRLNAIPAEFEVMNYLRAKGKILFAPTPSYTEWMNYWNGVDICFMDAEEPEPGYTNLAGIDVKNPDLDQKTKKDYTNFFIETATKDKRGEWSTEYAWATHIKNGANRYLAFVRGGKEYGGKKATDTEAYSPDKTEDENKRSILFYFFQRQELLNHTFEIISGEHVKEYLRANGDGREINSYVRAQLISFEEWLMKYPILRVENVGGAWQERQLHGNIELRVETEKRITVNDTDEVKKIIEHAKERQAGGVDFNYLQRLFGLLPE